MIIPAFLLTSWIPFVLVLPWVGRRDLPRVLWVPVVLGLLAAVYSGLTFWLWPQASIRLDLVLLWPVVWLADLGGCLLLGWALFHDRQERSLTKPARTAATLTVLGAAAWIVVAAGAWTSVWFETSRAASRFELGHRLLLSAKLQDAESARLAYGTTRTDDPVLEPWVGVWDLDSESRFTTLIVSAERRVWFRFRCGDRECEEGPGRLEPVDPDLAVAFVPHPGAPQGRWSLQLEAATGDVLDIRIEADWAGATSPPVRAEARRRTLPPPSPVPSELESLGTFSALEWRPEHVALTELRLWRDDHELIGLYLAQTALPGRETMLFPKVLTGIRPAADGSFTFEVDDRRIEGRWRGDALELTGRGPWGNDRALVLERRERVVNPALRLVPTSTREAWEEWMEAAVPPVVPWEPPRRQAATSCRHPGQDAHHCLPPTS